MDDADTLQAFLDVDDLKNIGALEVCIEESEVIMIYLSKGCTVAGIRTVAVGACSRLTAARIPCADRLKLAQLSARSGRHDPDGQAVLVCARD
jgi:FAD/FMN-containing dehydrogenase